MKSRKLRGAMMTEYGILVGILSVIAIGAVLKTGLEVEEVFCTATNSIASSSGRDLEEDCVTDPNMLVTLKETERFIDQEPVMAASFTSVTFDKGDTGDKLILVPVDEGITSGFDLGASIVSLDEYDPARTISACYLLDRGIDPICSSEAQSAAISVPSSAVAVGYLVTLGQDPSLPWSNDVDIAGVSDQSILIDVLREEADPLDEPVTFAFDTPYSFGMQDAGWTYGQFVPLEGRFNRNLTLNINGESGAARYRRACYIATSDGDPVCGNSAYGSNTASVVLPAGSVAVGYNMELPAPGVGSDWMVEERFSVAVNGSTHQQNVEIIRPNEEYRTGSLLNDFSDPYSFLETDEGWTMGEFVPLVGNRNTAMTFEMRAETNGSPDYKACYRVESGETTCGGTGFYGRLSSVAVPVDAVEIGYEVGLHGVSSGPDTSMIFDMRFFGGGAYLVNGEYEVIRPNADYQFGSIDDFSSPYSFLQTDSDWTNGEFIALTGARNADMTFEMRAETNGSPSFKSCYRIESGEITCGGTGFYGRLSTVTVPVEAVEIGYRIDHRDPGVGPDQSMIFDMRLYGGGTYFINDEYQVIRPNEPYMAGSVDSFASPYSYAQDDQGWTEGEFIAINGPRNTDLTFKVGPADGSGYYRKACYKTEVGGSATCGGQATSNRDSVITVPPEAVEIGYSLNLPNATPAAGPSTMNLDMSLVGGGKAFSMPDVTILRPNEPYATGSVGSFSSQYYFEQDDAGWTDGEFIAINGPRNTDLTFKVGPANNGGYYRKACYKTEAGGSAICGSYGSYHNDSVIPVPPEAVEIGYSVNLPSTGPSAGDSSMVLDMSLSGGGAAFSMHDVTIIRPNPDYEFGSSEGFSADYTFASSESGWTYGEFVSLSGTRNAEMSMTMVRQAGPHSYRQLCHRVGSGDPVCGNASYSNATARTTVPIEATEVGYRVQLPTDTPSADATYGFTITLSGTGTTLFSDAISAVHQGGV